MQVRMWEHGHVDVERKEKATGPCDSKRTNLVAGYSGLCAMGLGAAIRPGQKWNWAANEPCFRACLGLKIGTRFRSKMGLGPNNKKKKVKPRLKQH